MPGLDCILADLDDPFTGEPDGIWTGLDLGRPAPEVYMTADDLAAYQLFASIQSAGALDQ